MTEPVAAEPKKIAVPELLKNPKAALVSLEAEAKGRLKSFTASGNARLAELELKLGRLAREDWTFSALAKKAEALGKKAEALGGKARDARAAAVKRIDALPGVAVAAVATAGRTSVQEISKRLQWVTSRLEAAPKNGAEKKNGAAK
jgi:hypothetical protein